MLLWWWACAGGGPAKDAPPSDTGTPPAGTGGTGGPAAHTGGDATIGATCVPSPDNTLRYTCGVSVHPPAPVEITFARTDGLGATRTRRDDATVADHTVDLWFLAPNREYRWTARLAGAAPGGLETSGTFTTAGLPPEATVSLTSSGTSTAPYVGMASPCMGDGSAVIFETATDEVVWYQPFVAAPDYLDAVSFTEDGTVLGLSTSSLVEVDPAGHELLRLGAADLDRPLHHDVFRRAGLTYVLFQEPWSGRLGTYLLDGFYVYRGAERVSEWHLSDHFTPPADGLAPADWSHANAIWADADGLVYVSLRHLSTLLKVDPATGDVLWRLGSSGAPIGTDFAVGTGTTGPADFYQQHNTWFLPDGRLTFFDNRPADELSRVVDLRLDPGTGTATIEDEYPLPEPVPGPGHCDFQGGSWRTPAGDPIATCAPFRRGYELDARTGATVWQAEAICRDGIPTFVPRFVPLDW